MSRKHFSVLLVAVVVVIVAVALLLPGKTGREQAESEALLLPGVGERINDVDRVVVVTAGDVVGVTLERDEQRWTVAELGGYPADWSRVREVLAGLAQATIIEVKTDNPAYHDQLGVEAISREDASGVLVKVSLDQDRFGVVLGKRADSREGRYARLQGSEQSVLIDFDVDVPQTAAGWADEQIVDVPSEDVMEVEILHPDGEHILATKASADSVDFELHQLPEGRELKSSWSVNALGGVLASLRLDTVRPATEVEWADPVKVRVLTFDGLEVTVHAVESDDQRWIRLRAAAHPVKQAPTAADAPEGNAQTVDEEKGVQNAASNAGEGGTVEEPRQSSEPQAREDVPVADDKPETTPAERAATLNERVDGWAYGIPQYKFDTLTRRMEDLLEPLEESGGDGE